MTHLDLFSGIGGFALAAQTVWGSDYHCVGFCEIDSFCQQVLRKNFKGVKIYGDIRGLTAERLARDSEGSTEQSVGTFCQGTSSNGTGSVGVVGERDERLVADAENVFCDGGNRDGRERKRPEAVSELGNGGGERVIDLLTGGFPCQPFSTAGKRKGTEDDRFLWPEMRRVISEVRPRWIVGENVAGIIEMALGQVCAELESLDYEVQCFLIPACAVNAPHRRDRVWIVAHADHGRGTELREEVSGGWGQEVSDTEPGSRDSGGDCLLGKEQAEGNGDCPSSDTKRNAEGGAYWEDGGERVGGRTDQGVGERNEVGRDSSDDGSERQFPDWSRDWREVAFESCVRGVDDGLPRRLVVLPNGKRITESKWRQEALKCYGNSIVPQVAMEIMMAIKAIDEQPIELKEWNETPR